jgi:hypothetical protein
VRVAVVSGGNVAPAAAPSTLEVDPRE